MPIRVWENKLSKLPDVPILADAARQMRELVSAVEEIQEYALTSGRSADGSLTIHVEKQELVIGGPDSDEAGTNTLPTFEVGQATSGAIMEYDDESDSWVPLVPVQITVVTAMRYDLTTHKLQIKTRTANVLEPAAESGWTTITGGQAAECP